jgi:hypothetical protein
MCTFSTIFHSNALFQHYLFAQIWRRRKWECRDAHANRIIFLMNVGARCVCSCRVLLVQASVRTSTMKKHYADERRLLVSLLDFSQGFWPTCSWWPWESRLVKVEAQHTVDTLNDPRMLSTAPRWRFLVLLLLLDEDSVGYVFFSTNCDSVGYVGSGQANQSAWSLPFSNLAYRQFPSSMSMSIPATWGEIIY